MKRLPPHIGWPLLIVGFLVLGVTWSIGVVIASQSDGGPAIVEDYYEKAIAWDQEAQRRAESDAQHWQISISKKTSNELSVQILDEQGTPVDGLTGIISAQKPSDSKPIAELPLTPSDTQPGVYTASFSDFSRGLWDIHIDAEIDSRVVYTTQRKEF